MADLNGITKIHPALLLVAALIGGGGANLGINIIKPPRPDPYTGKMAEQRKAIVDEKLASQKAMIEGMSANQIRYWTAMRDHIKEPWHEGAKIRLGNHDREMRRMERMVEQFCKPANHTHGVNPWKESQR